MFNYPKGRLLFSIIIQMGVSCSMQLFKWMFLFFRLLWLQVFFLYVISSGEILSWFFRRSELHFFFLQLHQIICMYVCMYVCTCVFLREGLLVLLVVPLRMYTVVHNKYYQKNDGGKWPYYIQFLLTILNSGNSW